MRSHYCCENLRRASTYRSIRKNLERLDHASPFLLASPSPCMFAPFAISDPSFMSPGVHERETVVKSVPRLNGVKPRDILRSESPVVNFEDRCAPCPPRHQRPALSLSLSSSRWLSLCPFYDPVFRTLALTSVTMRSTHDKRMACTNPADTPNGFPPTRRHIEPALPSPRQPSPHDNNRE